MQKAKKLIREATTNNFTLKELFSKQSLVSYIEAARHKKLTDQEVK